MRVVHLNTSDFGGAAMAAINLHQALLDAGVSSDLLTMGRTRDDIPRHTQVRPFELGGNESWNKLRYKFRRVLETTGIVEDRNNQPNNRILQDRPTGFEVFTLPYSWFPITRHPLVQQADVLHLHWVSFGMLDHAEFFGTCKSKVVWTMHDMNPFTGGCHHADGCFGYHRACDVCPQLRDTGKAHYYWAYKEKALSHVPDHRLHLVAPSRWLAERAGKSIMMRGRSLTVIPNGFDRTWFRPLDRDTARKALGLPLDKLIILFNALDVTNPRKGMQLLLPALEGLGSEVILVCMGNSTGVQASGRTVLETGFLRSPEEIAQYYSAADLFVLPSLAENLPNTISEALLCGTPVVAFRTGGIAEQVDGTNGMLVDRMESAGLSVALKEALATDWDRSAIASEAAKRFDRVTMAVAYRELYAR